MVDVRGDVLRPPHCTTPAAVKANKNQKMRSFKSNECSSTVTHAGFLPKETVNEKNTKH